MTGPAPRTPGGRWRQRGLLVMLGLCFLASGILRLGAMDRAWASGAGSAAPAPAGQCAVTAPLEEALVLVRGRAEQLDMREAALEQRAQTLATAQRLLDERLARLAEAEARLTALLGLSDNAAEGDLTRLTQLYETMRPEEAAAVFQEMDTSFAAGFIARMRPEAGAALMAELPSDAAYAISVLLATRNATAPRFSAGDTGQSPAEVPGEVTGN